MIFKLTTLAAILTTTFAADGVYNYDETHIWDQVQTKGANECAGSSNSPIAIQSGECDVYHTYADDNGDCTMADMKATVEKNGVKIGIKAGATCRAPTFVLPGTNHTFTFAQLHIHLSSEHTIDGEYSAAEMHMVHVGPPETGRYSVLGTMITPDKPTNNNVFQPFVDSWKDARYALEKKCPTDTCKIKNKYATGQNLLQAESFNMHPYHLFETGKFYTYFGGLTTPPCTQAVHWNLATEPMKISPRQFAVMSEIILKTMDPATDCTKKLTVASKTGSTSRPPQPLNGRTVKISCPTAMKDGANPVKPVIPTNPGNLGEPDEPDSAGEVTSFTVGAISSAATMAAGLLL